MTLKEHVDDIRKGLQEEQFTNEAQVSHGIVGRLLDALDWPRYNTKVVTPEYSVQGTRVDFALCHPQSKPLIFIEVKKVGQIDEEGERQLFQYAFHEGVPVAVLTDGKEWHFFYPSGQGNYKDRRVCKLNLIAEDSEENVARLDRYLNYESIRTGEAIQAIAHDYQSVAKQREIDMSLPEAWTKLLQETDEFLLEVVADKTESLCGYKPTGGQVLNFLNSLVAEKGETPPKKDTAPLPAPMILNQGSQDRQQKTRWTLARNHSYFIEEWCQLCVPLQRRILDLDNSVSEKINKDYITYKKNRKGFVCLQGQRKWLSMLLRLDLSEIEDPRQVCIQDIQYGVWLRVVISKIGNVRRNRNDFTKPLYALDSVGDLDNISYKDGDLDYIVSLIHQAFENN
jgi:predicted type IV restriction endonuclease/predicted transport protein